MIKVKTDDLQKQLDEVTNSWKRALADYQNLEKRVSQERQELRERLVEEIIHGMLVILDSVQMAEKHLNDPGLTLAVKGFDAWLAFYKIKPIEVLHKPFNPQEMECVETIESNKENEVLEETRKGYMIGDKVLRPALVKVGKKQNNLKED